MDVAPLTLPEVATEIVAAARAREEVADFPGEYVERVRVATAALGLVDAAAGGVRHAALLLEAQSAIDTNVPVAGTTRSRRLVKQGAKRLIGWYVRYLGDQVSVLGRSAARLGLAVADRMEHLDAEAARSRAETQAELEALRARVAELEAKSPTTPPPAP
jgi:hypothetical protein